MLALGCALGLGAGCGDEEKPKAAATTTASDAPGLAGNLTVLAAASLSEAFKELGGAFEGTHPGTKVTFSFDASSALALQANNGAPADLFASADQANMKKVTDAGNATGPRVVAHNKLAIIVAKGNPEKVAGLADLDKSSVSYVLCAPEVPCGKYGAEALKKAGVKAKPKSLETNVKAVVTKVSGGEVDAGIGYVTDARAAEGSVEGIEISDEYNVVAEYPMAVLKQSRNAALANAFLDFILSPDSQAVLAKYGFVAV
jgi:molybdate transport system substrate-binding protein